MAKRLNVIIHVPIYFCNVVFSLGETDKQFVDSCMEYKGVSKKEVSALELEGSLGRCTWLKKPDYSSIALRVKIFPSDPDSYATLQHEIFHATHFILDKAGIKLCDHSDEAFAYLITFLTKEVYTHIDAIKNKK